MKITQLSRIHHHTLTLSNATFSVPTQEDFTLPVGASGSWTANDLCLSEFGINEPDNKLYIRIGDNINEVNLNGGGSVGPAGPTGPAGATGPGAVSYWGAFADANDELNVPNISGYNIMTFNRTDESNGIYIGGQDLNQITFNNAGLYNIQFSAVAYKSSNGADFMDIWFAKYNPSTLTITDIPYSNSGFTIHGGGFKEIVSWNIFVRVEAGGYVEIRWYAANSGSHLLSTGTQISPERPETPSVILTATYVGA